MKTSNIILAAVMVVLLGLYTLTIVDKAKKVQQADPNNESNFHKIELENFNSLYIKGKVKLKVEQSDTFKVLMQKSEYSNDLLSRVSKYNNTLVVNIPKGKYEKTVLMRIYLPATQKITLQDALYVNVEGFKFDSLSVFVEKSSLSFNKCDMNKFEIKAKQNSSIDIDLCKIKQAELEMKDSSYTRTDSISVLQMQTQLFGGSKLRVNDSEIENNVVKVDKSSNVSIRNN